MTTTDLTVKRDRAPSLKSAIVLWADARTDAASTRRRDLINDKVRAVGAFFAWVGKPPAKVTPLDVKAWQAQLESRGLAPATVYAMISRLSSFYAWAMKDPAIGKRVRANPVTLARPKAPKAYTSESCQSLDDEQAARLLGWVKEKADAGSLIAKRDYALLLFYLATGMRRREVLGLRWGDVKVNGGLALVLRGQVKGGTYRTRELADPRVGEALRDYLQASGRWGTLGPDDPLWTRHDQAGKPGEPLDGHSFAANLKRYAAGVGIGAIHLHQLRHTFARWVSEATGSLQATSEALDHANLATTRVYVQAVACKADNYSTAMLDRAGAR